MKCTSIYYEPDILDYPLGQKLYNDYSNLPWYKIDNHNRIEEMTNRSNKEFVNMKRYLIVGTRKTHKYVINHKISDYLVPFTSSGCTAMCLYCYLVCNYNKCSYLRLFVNREYMLNKLINTSNKYERQLTFEIGSNSDLILENTITQNLLYVIPEFAKNGNGFITFPTKFDMTEPLLTLDHKGKTIFRMSVNPKDIIRKIELGTSSLEKRIAAANNMCEAGYPVGILIAPVILLDNWQKQYEELFDFLADTLTDKVKKQLSIEVIFMTYSYIHRAINNDAFPNALELYNPEMMTGRGRGKYCYRENIRIPVESFIRNQIKQKLPQAKIIYIS